MAEHSQFQFDNLTSPLGQTRSDQYWRTPVLAADDRLVGGVAAALGREIGLTARWLRAAFLALLAAGGWGAVLYLASWFLLPSAESDNLERIPKGPSPSARRSAVVLVTAPLMWFGINTPLWAGIGFNGLLVLAGSAFIFVGISAPWWLRLARDRDLERQARVRSDERADVAAHLHDSVLQTLSLIQRNADDPQTMVTLARRQERELRNWLDPDRASRVGESIRGRLDQIATDVEELHGVPVEVVTAGDCLVDERISAALDAAREATVNAAKHSGAPQVDIYAEVSDELVEFFIRDSGVGFDRDQIEDDRRGLKESIVGRMERAGGMATVMSDLGEGTEIEISIARRTGPQPDGLGGFQT